MTDDTVDIETRRKQRAILEKRSAAGLEKKFQQENREEVDAANKAIAPPVMIEPRCRVCTYPWRLHIERELMRGRSYASIANSLPPDPETNKTPDRKSISLHSKRHMDLDSAVTRALLEEEAGALGQQWEEGVKGAFTMRGALEVMVRKAYDDAMNNVTTVEPRDMIQMIKLANEMSSNTGETATEEAQLAIRLFVEAIRNVLTGGDLIDPEQGAMLVAEIAKETTRLRDRDEIETVVETHLRVLPRINPIIDAEAFPDPDS